MMTTLIVLACVLTYLVVGAFYGRQVYASRYRRQFAKNKEQYRYLYAQDRDNHAEVRSHPDVVMPAVLSMLFWPIGVVLVGLRPGGRSLIAWWTAPIDQHVAQIEQLRADAKAWDEKARTGTKAEREMAVELARLCREQVKELTS